MPKDNKELEDMKYDLRIIEQKLRRGEINHKEYETFLNKLPDDEPNSVYIEVFEDIPVEEKTPHVDELTFTSA